MLVTKAELIRCSRVNQMAQHHVSSLVSLSETAYAGQIATLCKDIILQQRHVVFITGPSGSGKTTTAARVKALLRRNGKRAVEISLDDFYLPNERIPFWPGEDRKNFESIEALDLDYIAQCAKELQNERMTHLPVYRFRNGGRQSETRQLIVDENTYLIIEGIHALNPRLTELFPSEEAYKIYVSAHTDFVDDENRFVMKAETLRFVRRIIRDLATRGVSVEETLTLWEDVCRGERAYIRPFRSNADVHVNSTHYYEPLLYKPILHKLLESQPKAVLTDEKLQAVLDALANFDSIESWHLPDHSLLREFLPSVD